MLDLYCHGSVFFFSGKINFVAVPKVSSTPTLPKPTSSSSNGHDVAAVVPTSSAVQVSLPTTSVPSTPSFNPTFANIGVSCDCKPISTSSSDSDYPNCGTTHKRRHGLGYHLHHCRLSLSHNGIMITISSATIIEFPAIVYFFFWLFLLFWVFGAGIL